MPHKLLILLILIVNSGVAAGLEKVTLQLKWEHEFQFAGYYAADWQGYYREAGLEVEILPATKDSNTIVSPLQELTAGNAHFAIGSLDILTGQDTGAALAVLAPIFQRSPSAVFSLESTPINNLSELAKLKIAAVDNDATKIEIIALFKSRGFDISKITFVDEPVTIETLVKGKADAIVTYDISAKVQSQEKGVKLNRLHPADFGLNFYGDTLYTQKSFLKENPELVKRFVEASISGWEYALKNKREVAFQIANELERHQIFYNDLFTYNLTFASLIDELVDYPRTQLGHSNSDRWFTMNERLRSIGIVKSTLDKNALFETNNQDSSYSSLTNLLITIIVLLPLVFIFWYKRQLSLTLISIVTLATATEYQLETVIQNEKEQSEKLNLTRHLASVSAKLEGNLRTNLSMISGFAAYISASPNLTKQDFDNYAKELFKKEPLLINFAAAKDLVVNFVYPMVGNEKVIGLDYQKNKAQKEMVMQVVNTGQLMVVGPINLVQGGTAFIGRAPIFTGSDSDRRLWGIISAPLGADDLFQRSGISNLTKEANLAMRSFDSLGNQGPVFYGDENLFESPKSVQFVISVGGGTWHLAATSKKSPEASSFTITVSRLATIVLTILIASFAVYRFKQEKEKLAYQTTIRNHRRLLEKVGSVAKIGGWKVDSELNICQWSKQTAITILQEPNYTPKKLHELSHIFDPDDFVMLQSCIKTAFDDKQSFDVELKVKGDSSPIWTRVIAQYSVGTEGKEVVTGTIQDVTEKVVSAKLIEHQATYDALTDLPNRILFNDRLKHAIEEAKRENEVVGVLFIDIDRFKPVNDTYGHSVGDKLLIEASKRILSCVRDSDTVSRLSGDEFGVLLPGLQDFNNALKITEQIITKMERNFAIGGISIHCSASVGISLFPNDGQDAQSLISKADQAMYEVKNNGRNGWQFYTQEMQEKSEYRHKLLTRLIEAINSNQLIPYFQPIVNLQNNRVEKCEALARWINKDQQFISPGEFIPLAEESGLINKIDLMIFEKAIGWLDYLNERGSSVELSINVSPRLFNTKDKALQNWMECIELLSKNTRLTVEITERLLTEDTEKALGILNRLKTYGVKIAIDDFGTGYSSLSYLVKFPVDIIKIDRTFVEKINRDESGNALIETILVMAKRLNMKVIAEGIETQEQLEFLTAHGCDFGQGYHLGKPMSKHDFQDYITEEVV